MLQQAKSLRQEIAQLATKVLPGDTANFICPNCGNDRKFYITRDDSAIKYICHKLSCGIKGYIIQNGISVHQYLNKVAIKEPDYFNKPSHWIDGIANDSIDIFLKKYHIKANYCNGLFDIAYDPRTNRIIFYVYDGDDLVGAVSRALTPCTVKVYNCKNSAPVPFIVGTGQNLVIVEDCLSAARLASDNITGMALLGTHFKREYLQYLKGYNSITIALDADAKDKALKMQKYLSSYFPQTQVRFLKKDIKDMSLDEFNGWLEYYE